MGICVIAECFKASEEDEEIAPAVVDGEGDMNKELVTEGPSLVKLLDDVINVGSVRVDEEGKDKCDDIVLTSPDVDVNGAEDGDEGETPANAANDHFFTRAGELIDEVTEEQEVNEEPDEECPVSWGQVCLFQVVINISRTCDDIDVGTKEEEKGDNVDNVWSNE